METTERIVEAYCRYVKHWFTIPNIRVKNNEIDLIAVDRDGNKAHIEVGVSISGGFSKLKNIEFKLGEEKQRGKQAGARTKLGYFEKKKFGADAILNELKNQYGFKKGLYKKIIVAWGAEEDAIKAAKNKGIEVWLLPDLIEEIKSQFKKERGYYRDDTIRTLHLVAKAASKTINIKDQRHESLTSSANSGKQKIPIVAWERFVFSLPSDITEVTYTISEINKILGFKLQSNKAALRRNQFWQSKHRWVDIWREAGWKAKPIRDQKSGEISAVNFSRIV